MASTDSAIRIEGLNEFLRSFKRLEGDVPAAVRGALRAGASIVAEEAKRIAEQQGLRSSGDLIRRIYPGTRGSIAIVRDTAKRRSRAYPAGYPYPRRIEYEHDGQRAFMAPALDAKTDQVVAIVDQLLDAALGGVL